MDTGSYSFFETPNLDIGTFEHDLTTIDLNEIRDQVSLIRDLSKKFNELALIKRDINDTTFLDSKSQERY
ncbi:hypothetical protein LCGC14_2183700, partial [marine sediment metagenome]